MMSVDEWLQSRIMRACSFYLDIDDFGYLPAQFRWGGVVESHLAMAWIATKKLISKSIISTVNDRDQNHRLLLLKLDKQTPVAI